LKAKTSHDPTADFFGLFATDSLKTLVPVHVDFHVHELGLGLALFGRSAAKSGTVVSELLLIIDLHL
jgi:hypothetical protein